MTPKEELTKAQREVLEIMRDQDAWILAREGLPLRLMRTYGRFIKSVPRKTFEDLRPYLNSTTRRSGDTVYTFKAGAKVEEDSDAKT